MREQGNRKPPEEQSPEHQPASDVSKEEFHSLVDQLTERETSVDPSGKRMLVMNDSNAGIEYVFFNPLDPKDPRRHDGISASYVATRRTVEGNTAQTERTVYQLKTDGTIERLDYTFPPHEIGTIDFEALRALREKIRMHDRGTRELGLTQLTEAEMREINARLRTALERLNEKRTS
ncbi:MAG: hypothetical protein HY420_05275 [Candidatus Kerfeldbacteria bacterium]|nr:hypothetical protein [Candidatus Kerfeldbacteria bacterium]